MNDFLGALYFIVGGLIAGRAAYDGWRGWDEEHEDGDEFPALGFIMVTALAWLASPVVVGIYWVARKGGLAKEG